MPAPRPRPILGLRIGQAAQRGFTLIELTAVVLIITVLAGLTVPTVVNQLRDRRVQESARKVALLFRQARMRAMGRGGAVLVRFAAGQFQVREAKLGPASVRADCVDLPVSSCLNTVWGDPDTTRIVDWHIESATGDTGGITINIVDAANVAQPQLDICFTPMGRSFARASINDATAFGPFSQAYLATVARGGKQRARNVVLMPNGTARLSTPTP